MAGIERGRLECPELGQLGRTVPRLAAGFLFLVIFELAHGGLVAAAAGGRLYSQQCGLCHRVKNVGGPTGLHCSYPPLSGFCG